jgi:hypothetical protein
MSIVEEMWLDVLSEISHTNLSVCVKEMYTEYWTNFERDSCNARQK